MESGELTRKRAAAANLYAARQNPVDADIVTRNNRLKAAAQAFVAPYNQTKYINAPCCPPIRTGGAASDYGDSRLDEASFAGTAINTFTNVMDRRAGAAICCGPPSATVLPQGVRLYGDCSCLTAPASPSGLPPGSPTITSVIPGDTTLTVYFTAPTDDGGSPITSYRYLVDGVLSSAILTNTNPFTINGLTNGVTYSIIMYAVNAIGPGPNSAPETGIPVEDPMIITITTILTNTAMSLPFSGLGAGGITVNWGDGVTQTYTTTPIQKTYAAVGNYTIRITGSATTFGSGSGQYTGSSLITALIQWGTIGLGLTSLSGAFSYATKITYVPPTLPSNVNDLSYMFFNALIFNSDITSWNVSNVTNMEGLFYIAKLFNQNISSWNVSNVTNMASLFRGASAFNQDISGWSVSNVTNMGEMFRSASAFNQNLSTWNTSGVTNMLGMFQDATNFNGDITTWDVSHVIDFYRMFYGTKFNQNISGWVVSSAQRMTEMFSNATLFNQNISGWDVSGVFEFFRMFAGATIFNQNLSSWPVIEFAYAENIFCNSAILGQTLKYPPFSPPPNKWGC